jgi:DNA-binding NarL/FixJ family response regulator
MENTASGSKKANVSEEGTADEQSETPSRMPPVGNREEADVVQGEDATMLVLIDSRQLIRLSLLHLLETNSSIRRRSDDFHILPFVSADEFLSRLPKLDCRIGLILFNIGGASIQDGPVREDIRQLKKKLANTPLILLADRSEPRQILEAFRDGVSGYIPTALDASIVIQALRLIRTGAKFIPHNALLHLLENEASEQPSRGSGRNETETLPNLTPRQLDVLNLLRQGKSNKAIAYELGMRESTAKVHVGHIMRKLKVSNRTHAALLAS